MEATPDQKSYAIGGGARITKSYVYIFEAYFLFCPMIVHFGPYWNRFTEPIHMEKKEYTWWLSLMCRVIFLL